MILVESADAMRELGAKIGSKLKAGDLISLIGPLGAGKTELAKGIAQAFGIEEVTSPTFVIARSYKSKPPFIHMDAYRLLAGANSLYELEDLDLNSEEAVTLIEWGGELAERISEQYLEIRINRDVKADNEIREVTISGHGQRWQGFSI